MNYFKSFLIRYWYYFVIGILIAIISTISLYFYYKNNKNIEQNKNDLFNEKIAINKESENNIVKLCSIDIKGAVKNPGVYEIECDRNINDALALAGGKAKNAYTNNINLSKRVSDEMVIYVYTNKEFNDKKESNIIETSVCENKTIYIDTCLENSQSIVENNLSDETSLEVTKENETNITPSLKDDTKKLISLNTATKEELMTLSGIGESKALNIINYRETNNGFKNIEELKNVSGIGEAIFEKIKSNITL